jgi:hypothetical protein
MSPLLLVLTIYAVIYRLLWPILSTPAIVLIAIAGIYSSLAVIWMQANINSAGTRGSTAADRARDLFVPLFGALILPAPYLAGALAVLWAFEGTSEQVMWAGIAAVGIAAVQYSVYRWMQSRIRTAIDPDQPTSGS